MGNITTINLRYCPKCGTETILRMKIEGYQYLTGEWDGSTFVIHDYETETEDGPYEVMCDSLKCGWVGDSALSFGTEWA